MIEATRQQEIEQGSPQWLDWRKYGIGGSEVAAVLGLDQYKSALDVQRDKLGYSDPVAENGRMRAGKILEPHVAQMYSDATGRTLIEVAPQVHRDFDWMRGSADRVILGAGGDRAGALEIKTTGPMNFRQVKLRGVPPSWLLQLQWYLEIYDLESGSYAILDRDSFDLIHFDFPRDRDLMADVMQQVGEWWHRHIIKREPVEIAAPAKLDLPKVGGELVTIDSPDWSAAIDALRTAQEIEAEASALKDEAANRVKALMLAAKADVAEGAGCRVYYREQAGRKSVDYKAMLADHPQIEITKYERRGEPFRTFRVFETEVR